eukprot:2679574-Amphidinium_carterae.1
MSWVWACGFEATLAPLRSMMKATRFYTPALPMPQHISVARMEPKLSHMRTRGALCTIPTYHSFHHNKEIPFSTVPKLCKNI